MESYLDRIKALKNQRKMTNDQLSELAGIPLGTLSKILAGMSDSPKLSNIVSICNALGCSVEYIVSGTPENTNNYTLSGEEIRLIEDFRVLDHYGKGLVKTVLSMEKERALDSEEQATVEEATAKKKESSVRILPSLPVRGRYAGNAVRTEKRSISLYDLPVSAGVGVYL